jgi:hypothetical protein
MRSLTTNIKSGSSKRKTTALYSQKIKALLLEPISSGFFGFALFFTILLITKLLASYFGTMPNFNVDINDVILSSIGFVLMALIKFLENINERNQ